jgi:DNA-binding NarL/FixJ family response regulator
MSIIRIILADDHKLILDGIKALLENSTNIKVIAEAENGRQLVDLVKIFQPALVITDIDMPVMNGIETVTIIHKEFPDIKILALTMHKDKTLFSKMKEAGANGYIHKNTDKEELLFAIHQIMNGKEYTGSDIGNDESPQIAVINSKLTEELTKREIEILVFIANGMTNIEIGKKLFISDRTVDTHRTNLMRKLNVNNVAGLIRYAYKNDLVK